MIQIVHNTISDFAGPSIANTIPRLTESIIQNCYHGIDDQYELRPKKYEKVWQDISQQYNLFINIQDKALKWSTLLYDSIFGAWIQRNNITLPTSSTCLVVWNSLIWSFSGGESSSHSNLYYFDPNTLLWNYQPSGNTPPSSRYGYFACVYLNKMYIFGGNSYPPGPVYNELWEFDFVTTIWTNLGAGPDGIYNMYGCLDQGKIYIYGGIKNIPDNVVYVYDISAFTWTVYSTTAPAWRANSTSCYDPVNRKWYIIAGWDNITGMLKECWVHDFNFNTWTQIADYYTDIMFLTSSFINGKVYAFNGQTSLGDSNFCYEYDPNLNSWSLFGQMTNYDRGGRSVSLGNSIYLLSGYVQNQDFFELDFDVEFTKELGSIIHNTFYNCKEVLNVYDYKKEYWWADYPEIVKHYYNFLDNLVYINEVLFRQNYGKIDYWWSLLNGSIIGSANDLGNNLGPGIVPYFQEELLYNLRLIWAGFDWNNSGVIPQFSSPGAWQANDSTDMGAYHRVGNNEIEINFSSEKLTLESPPLTSWLLHSLHGNDLEGLITKLTFSLEEINIFQLSYASETYLHERNRTAHVFRQLRKSKSPIWWFPFWQVNPPIEIDRGRYISDNQWIWWKNLSIKSSSVDPNQLYVNNINSVTNNIYFNSLQQYTQIECNIYFTSALISEMDFTFKIGQWIIFLDQINKTPELWGIVTDCTDDNHKLIIQVQQQQPIVLQSQYDIRFHKSFWTGAVFFESLNQMTFDDWFDALIEYQDEDYGFKFPIILPIDPLKVDPFGRYDDFILSFFNENDIIIIIQEILNGTFVPTPLNIPFGNIGLEDYLLSFRLKSKRKYSLSLQNTPTQFEGECYDMMVIHPLNPFNFSHLTQTQMKNILNGFFQISGLSFHSTIDSLLTYISREDISSKNQSAGEKDVWFNHGSEWKNHYLQNKVVESEGVQSWSGQEVSLIQTLENRALMPIKELPYPYL